MVPKDTVRRFIACNVVAPSSSSIVPFLAGPLAWLAGWSLHNKIILAGTC